MAIVGRLNALLFTVCVALAGVVFFELKSSGGDVEPAPPIPPRAAAALAPPRGQQASLENLVATILAQPLFSPTRRPPDTGSSQSSDTGLGDVRLTGIVVEPDRRLAIFALSGQTKPLTLSEGEALNGWRLDNIVPEQVSLTGPGGTTTLEPKPDAKLVRQVRLPAAPAQPQAATPAGPAAAPPGPARIGAPRQLGAAKTQTPALPFPSAPKPPPRRPPHDQ